MSDFKLVSGSQRVEEAQMEPPTKRAKYQQDEDENQSDMITVRYCDIPKYLHRGAFYLSLDDTDPESEIVIPSRCFKSDATVENLDDFCWLLRVQEFWAKDGVLYHSILNFCMKGEFTVWCPLAEKNLCEGSTILSDLKELFDCDKQDVLLRVIQFYGLDAVQFFVENFEKYPEHDEKATTEAASFGKLDVLVFLQSEYAWNEETCTAAAQNGHLDCLKFAHENGCPWNWRTYWGAALNGHVLIMNYAFENGLTDWHEIVCNEAAKNGYLECLQFAREHGCLWNKYTTYCAAKYGHLSCLQYALDNGCPIDENACDVACEGGHLDCLMLLHEHDAHWDEDDCAEAAEYCHLDCLKYLHENDCPWDIFAVLRAMMHDPKPILEYLIDEHGEALTNSTFEHAMLRANYEWVKYLIDNNCPMDVSIYITLDVDEGDEQFPQDWEFTIEYPRYRTLEVDLSLLECIIYAIHYGWECNVRFAKNIVDRSGDFPYTAAYLLEEGIYKC